MTPRPIPPISLLLTVALATGAVAAGPAAPATTATAPTTTDAATTGWRYLDVPSHDGVASGRTPATARRPPTATATAGTGTGTGTVVAYLYDLDPFGTGR